VPGFVYPHRGRSSRSQDEYQRRSEAERLAIGEKERERIRDLATDFPSAWRAPKTPQRERKRMLGLLVEDVTLLKQQEVTIAVRFRGGATTTLKVPRPLTAPQLRSTRPEVREQMDALLDEYSDAQVANMLNERGMRTGAGAPFDSVGIRWLRFATKTKSLKERLLEAGWITGQEMQARLGVSRTTLGK
jgi:hypothetical protein